MSVIYVLITVSLVIALFFLVAFFIAVKSGQFDDSYTPSIRMLFENKSSKTNQTGFNDQVKGRDTKPLEKS